MAAAMAHHPSGLPTIKCSSCSKEIEISQMGDHTCSTAPPTRGPMDRFNSAFSSMRSNDKAPFSLRSKASPTGINTSAANRPFLQPAPPSPRGGQKSRFRMPLRSATSPIFRTRSPSPDLPLAQECAFPVFPTSRPSTPNAPKRSQTENHVSTYRNTESRNESRNRDRRTTSSHTSSRPASPSSTNLSSHRPLTYGSESTRKNSFSSIRSRPDFSDALPAVPPVPAFSEQRSQSPAGSLRGLRLPFGSPRESHASHDEASIASAEPPRETSPEPMSETHNEHPPEQDSFPRRPSQGAAHFRKPSVSAATRPLHEIGSVKTHRPTLSRGSSPNKFDAEPSASASGADGRTDRRLFDAPPVPGMSAVQIEGQDEPPRSQSAPGVRPERKPFDQIPPLPAQTKAHDFDLESNPYHTPSESISSSGSAMNTNSSRSSPPSSTFAPSRKQSDAGEAKLLQSFGAGVPVPAPLQISVPLPVPSPASAPISNDANQQRSLMSAAPMSAPPDSRPAPLPQPRRRPAKSFSRPNYGIAPVSAPQQSQQPLAVAQNTQRPYPPQSQTYQTPESPLDPAMQGGRLPVMPPQDRYGPRSPPTQPYSAPMPRLSPTIPQMPPSPGFMPPAQRQPSRGPPSTGTSPHRRATTGTKGNCRGCGIIIKGKSVSSADGRLTGRWHKECFVCKTCKEPFQTTDFYCLGNHPYCARHYHELNRSMCVKCDRGIEGHYVESDRSMKYHPHCFTCSHCHLILRDNYFEDGTGSILCEQHAFRGQTLGPGRRFPEKRSTRLMMMM